MESLLSSNEIPIGLGMALAENVEAMEYFSSLSKEEKTELLSILIRSGQREKCTNMLTVFLNNKVNM